MNIRYTNIRAFAPPDPGRGATRRLVVDGEQFVFTIQDVPDHESIIDRMVAVLAIHLTKQGCVVEVLA